MKVAYKQQTIERRHNEACRITEYHLGEESDINGVLATINGRYPLAGRASNLKCKELAYVCEGSGKLVIEGKELVLKKGDLVLIDPAEKYFWEGQMSLFLSCTPAWQPEQHVYTA